MKTILGLDLGTNSIGWALVNLDEENQEGKLLATGSRIIPMSQDIIDDFGKGQTISKTSERRSYRTTRRLRERHLLRRERLVKTLKILDMIPEDFDPENQKIEFEENNEGKYQFRFEESYNEMLELFRNKHGKDFNVPHDWTIYYLRKKALKEKINRTELAWLILQFNKKRGYYERRSEELDESKDSSTQKEFVRDIVKDIRDTGDKKGKNNLYEIFLDCGIKGMYQNRKKPEWEGKEVELIMSTRVLKDGSKTVNFSFPDENDWTLRKKKTEHEIEHEQKTVGEYIFDSLLEKPKQKIRGKLVHTIERKYYKSELRKILESQKEFHGVLLSKDKIKEVAFDLYPNNEGHRNKLINKGLIHIFVEDIIFYQRPLKIKKGLIDGCKYEKRYYHLNGEVKQTQVKVIPKSNPLFQEFRTWQFIHNLRIIEREHFEDDIPVFDREVTEQLINNDVKEKLFEKLRFLKEINQKKLLKIIGLSEDEYRWNYGEDQKIECNTTYHSFLNYFKKSGHTNPENLILSRGEELWHLLYSVEDHRGIITGLKKMGLKEEEVKVFESFPKFKHEYAAYSRKALLKLLPLMRCGKYWSEDEIDTKTKSRIENVLDGEFNEEINEKTREYLSDLNKIEDFNGLPLWLSEHVVYGHHSEVNDEKLNRSEDISFIKQHDLRNPVVEQVCNETLHLTKDIWERYGNPDEQFFDEIHIELSREIKKNKKEREAQARKIAADESWNKRVKAILRELKNDPEIEGEINPDSPSHVELFKIWEESRDQFKPESEEELKSIFKKPEEPTRSEIERYKLWADQKHLSPYTGNPIPLSKLFTREYDIEHVFPKARYYDDSMNNKIIAEREINEEKGSMTGLEFILKRGGKNLTLSSGRRVSILKKEEYSAMVGRLFGHNRFKKKILMSEDIPEGFTNRQMNDTRYISREITSLLRPVAKDKLVLSNGTLTSKLKLEWGLVDVMKDLMAWRFERLNEITGTDEWYDKEGNKLILNGFSKRLDHRHHALDAIIVACTTQSHIQYLSTLNSQYKDSEKREKFQHLKYIGKNKFREPWKGFVPEVKKGLNHTVVSFKNTNRILNKGSNNTEFILAENGKLKKVKKKQDSRDLWSIRQPLHKETVYGKIQLRQYKEASVANAVKNYTFIADKNLRKQISALYRKFDNDQKKVLKYLKDNPLMENGKELKKLKLYYYDHFSAARRTLDTSFNYKVIENVSNSHIRKILKEHLDSYEGKSEEAFSPEGIEEMNNSLIHPIYKVRVYESMGKKFPLGEKGNKKDKYVEAAKGTNLYFLIYENIKTGERLINENSSLAFKDVVELKKHRLPLAEPKEGYRWFVLSPGDLMYMPMDDERIEDIDWSNLSEEQVKRVYKMVSCTGQKCYFIQNSISTLIADKVEFESQNKSERDIYTGKMIKSSGIKIENNRLGIPKIAKTYY